MGALSNQTAAQIAVAEGADTAFIQYILELGEKAFWKEFDKYKDVVLFKRRVLPFWTITIKVESARTTIQAIFNMLTPEPITV